MLRIKMTICLLLMAGLAQAQSDLELIFEADDFVGGIPVNQTGVIRFTVINHGPDDFYPSSSPIKIFGSYNFIASDGSPFRFFSNFNSSDSACSLAVEHFDPPPPVNNYGLFMWGTIYKHIPAQSSVTCEFNVSVQQMAMLDMQWQLAHNEDPNDDNNSQQFTFRGLAASVLANQPIVLTLLVLWLLITTCRSQVFNHR